MSTQATLAQYVAQVRAQYIDMDGAFGPQCWDQWAHYANRLFGVPVGTTYTDAGGSAPHSGYACNVIHNAWHSGITRWFDVLTATATPRPGDVAFWEYGTAWYPWSHVATVLEIPRPGMLRCLTQNPGAVQIADLVTRGLIGYLRPRSLNVGAVNAGKTPTLTNTLKKAMDDDMAKTAGFYYKVGNVTHYLIVHPGTGSYHEVSGSPGKPLDGKYTNAVAATYGTGSFAEITPAHARNIKAAEDRVRDAMAGMNT